MRFSPTRVGPLSSPVRRRCAWVGPVSVAVVIAVVTTVVPAVAQEPLTSFDQLASRVTVGDRLWVTDHDGRETRGRVEQLTTSSLTLRANGTKLFEAASVSLIRRRQHDSLKNGALIGLGVGGGMATAWCIGALADDSGDVDPAVECSEGFIFAGLGTLIGVAVDAIIPGRLSVIYRADGSAASNPRTSVSVVPIVGTHRFMLMGVVGRGN